MSIHALRSYGIALALLGVAAFAACANSTDSGLPANSSAGAGAVQTGASGAGTAGAFVATAGSGVAGSFVSPSGGDSFGGTTFGLAGSSTGTAGSAGTAGSGGASGATCVVRTSALITSFASLNPNPNSTGDFIFPDGNALGGTFSYAKTGAVSALTLTSSATGLSVMGSVSTSDGFGIYFGSCTDASAYTGVSFNLKGTMDTAAHNMLSFSFQTNADTPVDPVNKKGTCVVPAGTTDSYPICHSPSFPITVTPGGSVITVNFSQATMGAPVATASGKDLVGLQWAFPWTGSSTDTMYTASVTITDLTFIGGPSGAGTAGSGTAGSGTAGSAGSGGASSGGSGG